MRLIKLHPNFTNLNNYPDSYYDESIFSLLNRLSIYDNINYYCICLKLKQRLYEVLIGYRL